jgi:hypothetical protein
VTDAVCAAIQEVAEEKGIDMPNPTYAVENTVKFGTEDAARIIQALGESPDAVTVKPVDDEDRDVGRNG